MEKMQVGEVMAEETGKMQMGEAEEEEEEEVGVGVVVEGVEEETDTMEEVVEVAAAFQLLSRQTSTEVGTRSGCAMTWSG